jgi:hypothetical protein
MPRPRINPEEKKLPIGVSMHPSDLDYLKLVFPTLSTSDAVHAAIDDSRTIRLPTHKDYDHA